MKTVKRTALSLALMLSFVSSTALSQPIDKQQKKAVVERISSLMNEHYVFPATAQATGEKLTAALAQGEFAQYEDSEAFAEALSKWLQEHAEDRHLRVRANPVKKEITGAESQLRKKLVSQPRYGSLTKGVVAAQVLEGNIGYMDLRGFAHLPESKEYLDSAMKLLSSSDAIIIDLRKNGGGSPTTVQYLCSYFFDEPLLLNSLYYREGDETRDFYVLDEVNGKKMPDVPLFVLTSDRTFSGAEEFSYNMQTRNRATLVGQTTGGGANPGGMFTINEDFRMFIATGTAINPVTKTNWESVGVKPDVEVNADDALDKAIALATEQLGGDWQKLKAQREVGADKLFSLLANVKASDDSLNSINKAYQNEVSKLITSLAISDRDLAYLAHESWEQHPKYAAFLLEIAVGINDTETFLYEYWARSLAKLNNPEKAKQIIDLGLTKVEGEEHLAMLKEALAEITAETKKL